ncbi:hypothetical protein [Cohnella faecalis]|uniref:hypothetical protein n=1 Tax=Cohnella faecalis TaxID=2315694 RepID=UPI001F2B525D|nr:hypothetical protein [Cohnella faecalis]
MALVDETAAYLRAGMLAPNAYSYFPAAYTGLWMHWIYPNVENPKRFEDELQHLKAAEAGLDSALSRHSFTLAQIWMRFFLGDDQEAWTLMKSTPKNNDIHPDDLMAFYTELTKMEQWSRLADWLTETGPLLTPRRRGGLERYYSFWETVLRHKPDAEPKMWDSLGNMLPYSAYIYEEQLLAYGKWDQWMDYQLSTGSEPLDHRATELQPLEKNAPELLLPFYHQAVERYVLLKNRDSYKAAVKLLKRLAKLYKKMKQEARWVEFFEMFVERHSRLRALQEELRKGKLLP